MEEDRPQPEARFEVEGRPDDELTYARYQTFARELHAKRTIKMEGRGWDVFRLVNFLSYMPNNFTCQSVDPSRHGQYNRSMTIREDGIRLFEIYATDDLEDIAVYLRGTSDWMRWGDNNCFWVKKMSSMRERPCYHPIVVFGQFFGRKDRAPCLMITLAFKNSFRRPWTERDRRSIPERLESVLTQVPGWVQVTEQLEIPDGIPTSEGRSLFALEWVPPWCIGRLQLTHYIELDASFKATKPYCYTCVNSIVYNESVTIALAVGITESSELYERAYRAIERAGVDSRILNKIPVLSDMGKGLSTFCTNRSIPQYFCHRHLLESFGEPLLRNWVRRILECTTREHYADLSLQISREIQLWNQTHTPPSKKLQHVIEMLNPASTDPVFRPARWAIFERLPFHIGRCTNHSEGLHRALNTKSHETFVARLSYIMHTVMKHEKRQTETHGASIRRKFKSLCNLAQKLPDNDPTFTEESMCTCGWNAYWSSVFGTRFPCLHEMQQEQFKTCPKPPPLVRQAYVSTNYLFRGMTDLKTPLPKKSGPHREKRLLPDPLYRERLLPLNRTEGPRSKEARIQFWQVISELQEVYRCDLMTSVDVAMVFFSQMNLLHEEACTPENLALFRVQCWAEMETKPTPPKQPTIFAELLEEEEKEYQPTEEAKELIQ